MSKVIDFSHLGGPVYVGRANGAQARRKLKLDALDAQSESVSVVVPEEAYAVNSSFFLGLFGPSLGHFETRDAFLDHYRFKAPEHIQETIRLIIDRALSSRGKLALSA